ncbi:hypothetical protein P4E94_04320 [Pontiellaceae bacterium B12219]|nr:hypothetical protein [Pontiellaceae bacterium B12219]
MKINTIRCVLTTSLILAGIAQASVVQMYALNGDGTGGAVYVDGAGVTESVVRSIDGDDMVYSFAVTGADLDGGGANDDALSWDVRFEAFNSSYDAGLGVTLGSSLVATNDGGEFNPVDLTWNTDQAIKFTVENINLTADAGYEATFDGFASMWLTAGTYYLGTGAGTEEVVHTANVALSFDPVTELVISTAANNERNRNLTGNFTVAIPEPASLGLVAVFGGGILFIRRFMQI